MKELVNVNQSKEIICLESKAFIDLLDRTVNYIKLTHQISLENKWISPDEAKRMLGITSNTSLQKLRDEGKIRYTQPMHKVILYDRDSINDFLSLHSKQTF
jgi:hypothetical protein